MEGALTPIARRAPGDTRTSGKNHSIPGDPPSILHAEERSLESYRSAEHARLGGTMPKTILLADDSVTIQKVVAISFASEDVKVVTVDNGDDAISKTREIHPDIVLADVVMPGKNGYQVCEAIKGDPALAQIPVLLLTGTFEAFDETRARSVGSAGHIAKPFEAQALVAEVRRLIAAAAPSRPPAPSRAAAPQVPTASQAVDEGAFDFFDDDLGGPDITPAQTVLDDGLELDLQNSGDDFTFDDSDLASSASRLERSVPVTPDAIHEVEAIEVEGSGPFAAAIPIGPELEAPPAAAAVIEADGLDDSLALEAGSSGEQPFDFAVAEEAPRPSDPLDDLDLVPPVDAVDLAQATVIDPLGASGYDVSFSDLGKPVVQSPPTAPKIVSTEEDAAEATMLASDWPPTASSESDADPSESLRLGNDLTTVMDRDPFDTRAAKAPRGAPSAIGGDSTDPMDLAEELYERPFAAAPVAAPRAKPTPARAEPIESIGPELREQLHDTLEKIAWESFGDLTEAIVRQSVERVEAIAWEVIPRMAEVLIQEEIRRLKSEPDED